MTFLNMFAMFFCIVMYSFVLLSISHHVLHLLVCYTFFVNYKHVHRRCSLIVHSYFCIVVEHILVAKCLLNF